MNRRNWGGEREIEEEINFKLVKAAAILLPRHLQPTILHSSPAAWFPSEKSNELGKKHFTRESPIERNLFFQGMLIKAWPMTPTLLIGQSIVLACCSWDFNIRQLSGDYLLAHPRLGNDNKLCSWFFGLGAMFPNHHLKPLSPTLRFLESVPELGWEH